MINVNIKEAAEMLSKAEKILLVCHAHPDGDTLGSAYGLKHAMQAAGHTVNVICADPIPDRLKFITDFNSTLYEKNLKGIKHDLVCAVDVAETELMGDYGRRAEQIDLKIDHHALGTPFAVANYIDGKAAACGEIVFEIIRELVCMGHAKITPSTATALYAAITSDTGCFKYSNVTSKTLRVAADLIDASADCETVCRRLFEMRSVNETVATRMMLNNLNVYRTGTMAVITVSNEMKEENGLTDDDLGGLGSYLREIEGIQLAVVIRQLATDPRSFKISMRSGPEINSAELCRMFGGGGHSRAAGATISASTPADAEDIVTEKIQAVIGFR